MIELRDENGTHMWVFLDDDRLCLTTQKTIWLNKEQVEILIEDLQMKLKEMKK